MGFMDVIVKALADTPTGKRVVAEARQAASDARFAKAAELRRATADGEAALRPLLRAEADARLKVEAAIAAYRSAQAVLDSATQARAAAAHQKDRREVLLEAELVTLAPPEINRFLAYLHEVSAAIAAMPAQWSRYRDARMRVVDLALAARERAEALRRSGASDPEIIGELQQLRGGIESAAKKLDRPFPREVAAVRRFEIGPEAA
jgi:hypothetical protein